MAGRVLMIGLRSDVVDFEKWPMLSVERLETSFREVEADLRGRGFEAEWCLVDTGETAEAVVSERIGAFRPDVVMIGAGVRADPDHLLLFEKLINVVHAEAPGSRIAFNTLPFDTAEAVGRWV